MLVLKGKLPEYALNIHLFSSQPCESTFRSTRALTGTSSSITNFTIHQFMNKTEKLSLLNSIKSSEETNDSFYTLNFPVHHKNKHANTNVKIQHQDKNLRSVIDIENIIISAYIHTEKVINRVNMEKMLKRHNIDNMNKLNSFISRLFTKTVKIIDHSALNKAVGSDDS